MQYGLWMVMFVFCALPSHAYAWKFNSQGELGLELRGFIPDKRSETQDLNVAASGRLTTELTFSALNFHAQAFVRFDALDRPRSAMFVEEGYAEYKRSLLRLRVGFQRVTWSTTEVFHPLDTINARYLDSGTEQQEKLGEPMLALRLKLWGGDIEWLYRPIAIDPIFPSSRSRLRIFSASQAQQMVLGTPIRMHTDGSTFEHRFSYQQWALRIARSWGHADWSLHLMQHMDRVSPAVFIDTTVPTHIQARMLFQSMTVLGATYVQSIGDFLLKIEAAYHWYQRPPEGKFDLGILPHRDYGVVAIGTEYNHIHSGYGTSTILLEGQWIFGFPHTQPLDASIMQLAQRQRPAGLLQPLFNHDIMLAYRYSFDDASSTKLQASAIVDVVRPEEFFITLSAERRLGDTWLLQTGARIVRIPPQEAGKAQGFENMNDAHQLYANIKRYF